MVRVLRVDSKHVATSVASGLNSRSSRSPVRVIDPLRRKFLRDGRTIVYTLFLAFAPGGSLMPRRGRAPTAAPRLVPATSMRCSGTNVVIPKGIVGGAVGVSDKARRGSRLARLSFRKAFALAFLQATTFSLRHGLTRPFRRGCTELAFGHQSEPDP